MENRRAPLSALARLARRFPTLSRRPLEFASGAALPWINHQGSANTTAPAGGGESIYIFILIMKRSASSSPPNLINAAGKQRPRAGTLPAGAQLGGMANDHRGSTQRADPSQRARWPSQVAATPRRQRPYPRALATPMAGGPHALGNRRRRSLLAARAMPHSRGLRGLPVLTRPPAGRPLAAAAWRHGRRGPPGGSVGDAARRRPRRQLSRPVQPAPPQPRAAAVPAGQRSAAGARSRPARR